MKLIAAMMMALFFLGCSDTVPEVRYLVDPSLSRISDKSFADADVAAATSVSTSGYTGTIVVHAGNKGSVATTTDNAYRLSIRKISY